MLYKNNCYIYLEATAGIIHREDFRITDTPESFRISRASFYSVQNTNTLITPFLLRKMLCLLKWYGKGVGAIVCLENHIIRMIILKHENSF